MFFRKRGKIRKQENNLLLWHLEELQQSIKEKEILLSHSVHQHNEFSYRAKIEKAKYLFLLKEARYRNVGLK